jgi:hypothetical protein
MSPTRTVPVFEAVPVESSPVPGGPLDRPVQARGFRDQAVKVAHASVDVLKENTTAFIAVVGEMLEAAGGAAGSYVVDTIEVECQISGSGQVGFAGTGMGVEGGASMKIVLKRKAAAAAGV